MCHDELTLSLYVDRELPEADRETIDSHLGRCPQCHSLVTALEIERRALHGALHDPGWATSDGLALAGSWRPTPPPRHHVVAAMGAAVLSVATLRFLVETAYGIATPSALAWLNPFHPEGFMNLVANVFVSVVLQMDVIVSAAVTAVSQVALLVMAWAVLQMLVRQPALRSGAVALALLATFVVAAPSEAMEVRRSQGSVTVPASETVDDTLVALGETTVIEGTVTGDLIAAGRRVRVVGTVKGNVFAFAQTVDIEGVVEGGVFVFGQTLTTRGHAAGSLYAFGQSVIVPESGRIDGNATTFSQTATIDGHVGRDVTAFGQRLDLKGTVEHGVTTYGNRVTLLAPARIGGALTAHVPSRESVQIESGATVAGASSIQVRAPAPSRYATTSYYVGQVGRVLAAFLAGWLLVWLMPAAATISLNAGSQLFRAAGVGALCTVATPVLALVLAITLVGLPIAVGVFFAWVVGLYLAKIVLAVIVGRALLGSRGHDGGGALTALALGLVALTVVVNLPYVGTLTNVLFTITGLGVIVVEAVGRYRGQPHGAGVPA